MTIQLYELTGAEDDRQFSPNCWRTRLALLHKGLDFRTVPWRFVEKDRIAPSGDGRVPVIVDGERWINDSWQIAGYLEDTYPQGPSLFGGPMGRALSRFYTDWTDLSLHVPMVRIFCLEIHNHLHPKDQDYFRATREKRIGKTLEQAHAARESWLETLRANLAPVRQTLAVQPYLGGNAPLYPDYIVFSAFQWARCISPLRLLQPDDPIYAWRERMLSLFNGIPRDVRAYPV